MPKAPTFEERKAHYEAQWSIMKVKPERVASVDRSARLLLSNKSRYETVASATNVPWFIIAIIHMREASGSFAGVLHNGEKIIGTGRKTKLVPAGRGPFKTWEDAAIDALNMKSLGKVKAWPIARICYEVEAYNGWGYWWRGDKSSAYLWAGTNIDGGGKFIADHVWSSTAQDQQNGAMAVLQRLMELDPSIAKTVFPTSPSGVPSVAPTQSATSTSATSRVDPQRQVGGVLNAVYAAIRAVLSRKA
jgi:lysozyme family protein